MNFFQNERPSEDDDKAAYRKQNQRADEIDQHPKYGQAAMNRGFCGDEGNQQRGPHHCLRQRSAFFGRYFSVAFLYPLAAPEFFHGLPFAMRKTLADAPHSDGYKQEESTRAPASAKEVHDGGYEENDAQRKQYVELKASKKDVGTLAHDGASVAGLDIQRYCTTRNDRARGTNHRNEHNNHDLWHSREPKGENAAHCSV